MTTGHRSLLTTTLRIYRQFQRGAVTTLAAAVAYHTLFAFVPLLIFLTAMVGVVSRVIGIDSVMSGITEWLFHRSGLPAAAAETIRGPIESIVSTRSGAALGLGGLLSLWGAQNGVRAMMRALNVAYGVEEGRNWFVKTAVATGLTISVGLALLLVTVLLLAGGTIGRTLADWLHLSGQFQRFWGVSRWILAPVMLALGLAVLYWAGPNRKAPIRWISPGAIIAVILFGAATWGLGLYFTYAARYVSAYGVLGAVMAFVFWLYVMATIALLGATINAVLEAEHGIAPTPRVAPKPESYWVGLPLPEAGGGISTSEYDPSRIGDAQAIETALGVQGVAAKTTGLIGRVNHRRRGR